MSRKPLQYGMLMAFLLTGGCSTACISAGLLDIIQGTDNVSGAMIITIFCIGTLLASIVGGFMSFKRPEAKKISEYEEKLALALAQQKGGILSVAELALKTSMDVDRSREVLDRFVNNHVAEPDVTADGEIVYRFPAFSRNNTQSVMEFEFTEEDYEFGEAVESQHFEKHEQDH